MQQFAFYDLDKTVTLRATWTRFLLHAARQRAPWRFALLPFAGVAALGHPLRLIDRGQLKAATQRLMLGSAVAPEVLAALAQAYAARVIARNLAPGARAAMAADRAAGYRLVLATASPRFYAEPIAAALGFDAVIATENRRDSRGRILPGLAGPNCYGAAKLARVQAWLAEQGIARRDAQVRAYSDHVSDAPLLDWADEAFAVHAHAPLARLAARRGWQRRSWRG